MSLSRILLLKPTWFDSDLWGPRLLPCVPVATAPATVCKSRTDTHVHRWTHIHRFASMRWLWAAQGSRPASAGGVLISHDRSGIHKCKCGPCIYGWLLEAASSRLIPRALLLWPGACSAAQPHMAHGSMRLAVRLPKQAADARLHLGWNTRTSTTPTARIRSTVQAARCTTEERVVAELSEERVFAVLQYYCSDATVQEHLLWCK